MDFSLQFEEEIIQGVLEKRDLSKIVIFCHGFTGNREEDGRFTKVAQLLWKENISTCQFDFRGAGRSSPVVISLEEQLKDLNRILQYVKNQGFSTIGLLGFSLGGITATKGWTKDIKTMVLWAPVSAMTPRLHELKAYKNKVQPWPRLGRTYYVAQKMAQEVETFPPASLGKITSPTLILHGDRDTIVPLEHSKEAIKHMNSWSTLEIISGTDHQLLTHIDIIAQKSTDWFKGHL